MDEIGERQPPDDFARIRERMHRARDLDEAIRVLQQIIAEIRNKVAPAA